MRLAIYKRVSTDKQTMASQEHSLNEWLSKRPAPSSIRVFEDQGKSGSTNNRPGFKKLCQAVDNGEVDAVLVYRLDRLSRRATDAIELLIKWINKDIEFFAADQPVLNLGKDQPFRLTILSIFSELAQIERDTLISRVKAGMQAAKARGTKIGRQRQVSDESIIQAMKLKAKGLPYSEIAKKMGIPKSTAHVLVTKYAAKEFSI